jgi:hypothetical protein
LVVVFFIASDPFCHCALYESVSPGWAQEYTRKKIGDFLHSHTAYELIPESGKVIVIDVDLPVRQAFHALHEQVGGSVVGRGSQAGDALMSLTRTHEDASAAAGRIAGRRMACHS